MIVTQGPEHLTFCGQTQYCKGDLGNLSKALFRSKKVKCKWLMKCCYSNVHPS